MLQVAVQFRVARVAREGAIAFAAAAVAAAVGGVFGDAAGGAGRAGGVRSGGVSGCAEFVAAVGGAGAELSDGSRVLDFAVAPLAVAAAGAYRPSRMEG